MTAIEELDLNNLSNDSAAELFDSLDTVPLEFMMGDWLGEGFHTNHPLDGLLETYHWHGKSFEGVDDVHPLVFNTVGGGKANINPGIRLLIPILKTSKSRARLRMTEYRGKVSATMAYDQLPIHDVFRKLDENTVLGAMDLKGLDLPFFFVLRRVSTENR